MLMDNALNIDLSPLQPFIEHDTELPKTELIHRCDGKINYSLFNTLKITEFYRLVKDSLGNMYLI